MNKLNRIRTPPQTKEKEMKKDDDTEYNKDDECKLHLAECYLSKKRIDLLSNEIEEKDKQGEVLKVRVGELEVALKEMDSSKINEVNDYKLLVSDLMTRISILEKNHEYGELVKYYEEKFEENKRKNESNMSEMVKMINKLSNPNKRDEIWRKAIKKFEERIISLENEISTIRKFERSIFSRQKFFEKYSNHTEEKIEKFSKLQKKCELLEEILKELQTKCLNLEKENLELKKDNSILNSKCNEFRDEFSKMKKFFNEIQPVLKIEWQDIYSENTKTQQNFALNEQNDFSNHNIVKLIENMKEFLDNYQNKIQLNLNSTEDINLNLVFPIIEDIKKYLIVLLRKVQHLTLNQYHIINICCDLNEKIQDYGKKTRDNSFEYLKLLKDLRYCCSKLLYDLHPEKVNKKV